MKEVSIQEERAQKGDNSDKPPQQACSSKDQLYFISYLREAGDQHSDHLCLAQHLEEPRTHWPQFPPYKMGEPGHFTQSTIEMAVEPSSPDKDRAVSQGRERKAVISESSTLWPYL